MPSVSGLAYLLLTMLRSRTPSGGSSPAVLPTPKYSLGFVLDDATYQVVLPGKVVLPCVSTGKEGETERKIFHVPNFTFPRILYLCLLTSAVAPPHSLRKITSFIIMW